MLARIADHVGPFEPIPVEIVRFPEWYVFQIEPQHEHSANAHLIARRFRTYLPVIPHITTRGVRRKKVTVHRPMFRGYLFVHLDLGVDLVGRALSTPGVHRFLKFETDGQCAVVSEDDMQKVRVEEEKRSQPEVYRSRFEKGECVRVSEGILSGLNVEIDELGDEERITILVSLLGRSVRTKIDPLILDKL